MYARIRYNNTRLLFKHYVTVLTGYNNISYIGFHYTLKILLSNTLIFHKRYVGYYFHARRELQLRETQRS